MSVQKQARSSKIQIEVKEIPPQSQKETTAQLNTDADGADLSNK